MFNPDDPRLDPECRRLCTAINRLPRIGTYESCCGHGQRPFWVWFRVGDTKVHPNDDLTTRSLLLLSKLCEENDFDIKLTHNLTFWKVVFLLESRDKGQKAFKKANIIADEINAHLDRKVKGFNILFDNLDSDE